MKKIFIMLSLWLVLLSPSTLFGAAVFGAAVAGYIVYKVGEMGSYAACKKYHNSNKAWDLYCDSSGFFVD